MFRVVSIALVAALALGPTASIGMGSARRDQRPPMKRDYIPFGDERKRQMGGYSKRHYGVWRWKLTSPDVIVLHFTGGDSYESARNHFASNSPNRGELPGVCAHFIIEKDGMINKIV